VELAGLFLYPVKSLRGVAVEAAAVDALGLVGDRRFMVVNPAGLFLTQRALPGDDDANRDTEDQSEQRWHEPLKRNATRDSNHRSPTHPTHLH